MRNLFFFISLLIFSAANAQQLDRKFDSWSVFTTTKEGQKICYLIALPTNKIPQADRGESYIMVTNFEHGQDEISISAGYVYADGVAAELEISGEKYQIFTYDNLGWANSRLDDKKIIQAMRKNTSGSIKFTAQSSNSISSQDTYSLNGFEQGYIRTRELCK